MCENAVGAALLQNRFQLNEKWLAELLDGKAKEHLLDLINIHDELIGAMTDDSFREGFVLGARIVMEVVGDKK